MAKDGKAADEGASPAAVRSGGGTMRVVLIVLGALVLVGLSVGATLLTTGLLAKPEPAKVKTAKKKPAKPQPAEDQEEAEEGDAAEEGEEPSPASAAVYLDFDQPFVVNFQDQGQLRYLQVSVAVMGRDEKMPETVKRHMPRIRNNLVMLFSNLTREAMVTREGKEKIRADAQAEVQKILREQTGRPVIEQLYLTSFVMQ